MKPTITFAQKDQRQFFSTLRKRVNEYFKQNNISKNANYKMVIKTIVMFSLYIVPYFLILTNQFSFGAIVLLAMVMGIGFTGLGFSVMHDAIHGAYTKYPKINKIIGFFSMDMIGGNTFTWKVQHNMMHHTYTNIYEMDEDIHDKPGLRLSPHGKLKKYHRFQHIYASFLYMLMTISWVISKDFKQLVQYNKTGLTKKLGFNKTKVTWSMIGTKLFFYTYMFIIPILVLNIAWWQWIIAFLAMHALAGFIMAVVFQLAHVVEGTEHHKPTQTGSVENTWAIHQLSTTANFARHNPIISWYVGGLNFQIEHHLFPNICHIHYKEISEIVKATAKEFGISYHDQPSFWSALASHFKILKQLGRNQALEPVVVY